MLPSSAWIAFQPIIDPVAQDHPVVEHEALLRFGGHEGAPGSWIRRLERSAQAWRFDAEILGSALEARAERGLHEAAIAVNVSPLSLEDERFVTAALGAIRRAGMGGGVSLEVTERLGYRDAKRVQASIERLHEGGVGVSLDDFDFGGEYLQWLELPWRFHRIKLDRAMLNRSLTTPDGEQALVEAINRARHAAHSVVVEGVETPAHFYALNTVHRPRVLAQGYLFGYPQRAPAAVPDRREIARRALPDRFECQGPAARWPAPLVAGLGS